MTGRAAIMRRGTGLAATNEGANRSVLHGVGLTNGAVPGSEKPIHGFFLLPKSEVFAIVFRWIDTATVQEKGAPAVVRPDVRREKNFV